MFSRSSRLSLCDPVDYNTTQLPCPPYFWEFTQTHVHWVDGGIQPSCPLLSPSLSAFKPSILSSIRGFSSESALHIRWPGIGASTSALVHIQGWFLSGLTGLSPCRPQDSQDESLLQHHSSKTSIVWFSTFFYCPAFTSVHDYWKSQSFGSTDLCRKVMSLLLNMLSSLSLLFFHTASVF